VSLLQEGSGGRSRRYLKLLTSMTYKANHCWSGYLKKIDQDPPESLEAILVEQEVDCNVECKTIERTCQEVIGYHDTDVADFFFNSKVSLKVLHC